MQEIIDIVSRFGGALVVMPESSSEFPELAWGDAFFYFAPDQVMPERTQPYGTMITKNYPDDQKSELNVPGRFRMNIYVGHDRVAQLAVTGVASNTQDEFFPHPLYGAAGWVSVVNPEARTSDTVVSLLREAHEAARDRATRRSGQD